MPRRNTGDGSSSEPVKGDSFRGEFTRLEREYVLARSILAARHATGMSKGAFAKAVGASKGKLSRWERAEAIPRLEVLQRIANVTGLSFQIGIEPLETQGPATTKRTAKRSSTRKASAKPAATRKPSKTKSTTRKSSARKTGAGRSAATGSTGRNSFAGGASRKSPRAKRSRKSSGGGAS